MPYPILSIFCTICNAAYLASSRFCFASGFSPSASHTRPNLSSAYFPKIANKCKFVPLQNGLGKMFWKGAAWRRSMTSSCDSDCSIMRQKRTMLPNSRKLWKSSVRASGYCTMSCRVAW